jgi:hypothetical protein
MKSPAAIVATAIPLILTSLRVTAGELPFNAPATEQARESAPLLHETARALHDSSSEASVRLFGDKQISNLWLFPTADAHTVFAQYNLTSNEKGTSGAAGTATEHLAVLTVAGNRVIESYELTSPASESVSKHSANLDRSAAIGTGYAAHADVTNSSHGVPASPHWTASIGTGTAATSITAVRDAKRPSSSGTQQIVAEPHWTSRIGRGDAFDSSQPVAHESLANAR